MIAVREVVYALYGAYRLCRFDPQGLAYFDATPGGFWRSFYSALLIAPIHLVTTLVGLSNMTVRAGVERVVLIEALSYVILVFAYPLIMYHICELLDRQRFYVAYVVAYNWAGVLLAALTLPAAVLAGGGLLPTAVAILLQLGIIALTSAMLWYIAKTTLQLAGAIAAMLVAFDLVLSLVVQSIAEARLAVA